MKTLEYIKPSQLAKIKGVHYRTIVNHFKQGLIEGYRDSFGNIWVKNPLYETPKQKGGGRRAIIYARVSSQTNSNSLEGQLDRMRSYCAAKGYTIVDEVAEVASGLNDGRKKFQSILRRDDYDILVAEHSDRLTRFGLDYLETLLDRLGVEIDIINKVERKDEDIMNDFVSIVTSFCGRIYGTKRRAKTDALIKKIKEGG